jgi:glycosyltransferase involved in cell wall biosynthesis
VSRDQDRLDIAQIVPYYPPHLGGMEVVAASLAECLAVDNRVRVLTSRIGAAREPKRERHGNLSVRRFPAVEVANTPVFPTALPSILALSRRTILHVHVTQAFAPELAAVGSLLGGRPLVAHYHMDVDPTGYPRVLAAYKRLILAPILRRAGRVIVLDDTQATLVAERYRVSTRLIELLPNGVHARFFSDDEPEAIENRPYRLLFVGRLSAQKNLNRLLDAARLLRRPIDLVVVGDGEQRANLEQRVTKAGQLGIRLVGRQTAEALVQWYRWADVLVSSSDREGMPLAFLEAMAAGVPIVGTDVPGSRETLAGVGVVVPPTAAALAGALEMLAGDQARRREMAAAGRRRVAGRSWDTVSDRLVEIYRELV